MRNILEFIENSAARLPDKTAIADEKEKITYQELLCEAERIGSFLSCSLDGRYNKPVAVLLGKSVHSVEAFMGVVESGNFYVVLDVEMPIDRMRVILKTLEPVAVLTDAAHFDKACELAEQEHSEKTMVITMEDIKNSGAPDKERLSDIRRRAIDTDPVYALFTSGSTGIPKGAVISHKNIITYIRWYTETFGICADTVFGNQTPFYFSMSVSDLYSTLMMGATLHIIPKTYFSFPIKLMEFMNERKVNTIYWVPSALCIVANYKMFSYAGLPHLKKVLFAGEVMPTRQLNYWIENIPDAMYANLFGPTETTDICTYYIVNRKLRDDEAVPMGWGCSNCDVFVLDDSGALVENRIDEDTGFSREGELYARGSFVAMGYYGNSEKTKEAFVQNPLNPYYPELVYKTGDLVKYNRHGELVYVTRKDFQIKHMGYRIELGEIEAAAGIIEGLKSYACVYDKERDKIVFIFEGAKLEDEKLASAIGSRVPHYMVPNIFVRVKSMPHNANGKIDRKWLQDNYQSLMK